MEDDDSDILSHQIHDNSSTTVVSFMQHHNHVLPSCAPERKGQPKVQSVCFKADRPTSIKPWISCDLAWELIGTTFGCFFTYQRSLHVVNWRFDWSSPFQTLSRMILKGKIVLICRHVKLVWRKPICCSQSLLWCWNHEVRASCKQGSGHTWSEATTEPAKLR